MIRIGFIGTESTHVEAFASLAQASGGAACAAAVLDEGDGAARAVAAKLNIPAVCASLDEMLPLIDALMICHRLAGKHLAPALAAIRAKKAVFIDKPVTATADQLIGLMRAAKENGVVLDGGSTCSFCPDVALAEADFERFKKENAVLAANMNYMGNPDSPFDGLMFYGPHSMSIASAIFGPDARSVTTLRQKNSVIALLRFEDFALSVHLCDCAASACEIYLKDDIYRREFAFAGIYEKAFEHFLNRIVGMIPDDAARLIPPVAYLDALIRSLKSGTEEPVLLS